MPRITTKQAISQFAKVLEQVKALRNEDAKEGFKEKIKLEKKLAVLVKMAFDDHEEKRKEYDLLGMIAPREQDSKEVEERARFLADLKRLQSTIEIYLEELEVIRELEQNTLELVEKEANLEKAKSEAEKAGAVDTGRIYHEAIEMLQRLKEEMKGRSDITLEMTEIKTRLLSAEQMINLLVEHTDLASSYDLEPPQEDFVDPDSQAELDEEQAIAEAEVMQELALQQDAEDVEMMQELHSEEVMAEQEFEQEPADEEVEFEQEKAAEEVDNEP